MTTKIKQIFVYIFTNLIKIYYIVEILLKGLLDTKQINFMNLINNIYEVIKPIN